MSDMKLTPGGCLIEDNAGEGVVFNQTSEGV
jgi:hypothetical protein